MFVTFCIFRLSYLCNRTNHTREMKLISSILLITSAFCGLSAQAGEVSEAAAKIEVLPGLTPVEMDPGTFGKSAKELKVYVLDEEATVAADKIFETLQAEDLWLKIDSNEAAVAMYGEKTDEEDTYQALIKVYVPDENMTTVLILVGEPEMFMNSINF